MTQLSLFDQTGLRYRWHLYKSGRLMYTAIPSQEGVTLIGITKTINGTKEILKLTYAQYETHKRKYKLEEVGR